MAPRADAHEPRAKPIRESASLGNIHRRLVAALERRGTLREAAGAGDELTAMKWTFNLLVATGVLSLAGYAHQPAPRLFVGVGDDDRRDSDFIAVLDVTPTGG